ncbi:hypothetical protein KII98_02830 [Leuconostoc gelidum subsp. gasicomitatum]|uniref:hypothetical protein n=1 Tax=Leuconostoc gasicomitatum TaxID=115778 RepID=UPI000744AA55|nr:hypothetical protein [Leuconostoc gasicomitatum]MBZ5952882.1 hypothetical protein [Leuconostoc gasicomitatum]CUR63427.1 Uncharacterized protein LEKG_0840 [Leuconostoc gasicomitatum KG16-1]
MAIAFQLTPERIEELRLYHEIGWPPSLTMNQLELYERTSITTLRKYLLGRDDAPFIPFERGGIIPLLSWEKFKAAVSVGKIYDGEI